MPTFCEAKNACASSLFLVFFITILYVCVCVTGRVAVQRRLGQANMTLGLRHVSSPRHTVEATANIGQPRTAMYFLSRMHLSRLDDALQASSFIIM